ncbi:MAG: type II secretion system F family protein [Arcobacteraceae bacterium]|jgi:type II secretory pathway component PulF|nr:type II secretion system F family protein [Arcobacteraceae bacterium]
MKYKITFIKDGKLCKQTIISSLLDEYKEKYDVISIKEQKRIEIFLFKQNIESLFKELSIIVNSSLSFADGVELLLKNTKNTHYKEILTDIQIALNKGDNLEKALIKYQKQIGVLPILFFKVGFDSGDIKKALNNLVKVLNLAKESKKRIFSALAYPIVVMIFFILAMVIIFNYVVPEFEGMYQQFGSTLPFITRTLLFVKSIILDYGLILMLFFLIFAGFFKFMLKNSFDFKHKVDRILFSKIPIVSRLIYAWQMHRFFLTLESLVDSKYRFALALEYSKTMVTNSFFNSRLEQIQQDIKGGNSITTAFEKADIFDELTIRLIFAGEVSNRLDNVTKEIEKIFYEKLENHIRFLSAVVEPLFLIFVGSMILWVISALMLPIWDMGNLIK